MRQDKKRILRITEELVNFLFTAGATDVRTRIQREPERYLLTIESDFSTDKRGELEELSEYFGRTGQYGAAEEYWELIGDQPGSGSELMLIGMMVSSAQIELSETSVRLELEIRLSPGDRRFFHSWS